MAFEEIPKGWRTGVSSSGACTPACSMSCKLFLEFNCFIICTVIRNMLGGCDLGMQNLVIVLYYTGPRRIISEKAFNNASPTSSRLRSVVIEKSFAV